jgi:aryl-alcohol dehydrogenase-like predicted oxidoreductase
MIPLKMFGRTGHESSRTIFGAASLGSVTQDEADRTLDILLQYGVNHIDTAASYGDSELRVGPWMKAYRKAKEELHRSLDRLKVDSVDLWQMHMLVNPKEWEVAIHSGGVIDAFIEAKEQGLVRFTGVTGHGLAAPAMHLRSLKMYDFDAVLCPYNYVLMQNQSYAAEFEKLVETCTEQNVAIQTIKSIARGALGDKPKNHAVWYDPLVADEAIGHAVKWVLGNSHVFLNTVGDIHLLGKVLKAADQYDAIPGEEIMRADLQNQGITPLFTTDEI